MAVHRISLLVEMMDVSTPLFFFSGAAWLTHISSPLTIKCRNFSPWWRNVAGSSIQWYLWMRVCVCDVLSHLACIRKFLGTFAKLQIATINLITSARLSVRPHGKIRLPLDGFSCNLSSFGKSVEKIQVSLKYEKNDGYFTWWPTCICNII